MLSFPKLGLLDLERSLSAAHGGTFMERPTAPAEAVGVSLERHGDGAGVSKERIKEFRVLDWRLGRKASREVTYSGK